MKKIFVLAMALLMMVGFSAVSMAAGIVGSDHDFSSEGWNSSGEICIVCHTPHNADNTVADAPLWNHEVTTTDPFTLYSSSTFDADDGSYGYGQPGGVSKLCLSCHDGTVALDAFGGAPGNATNKMSGSALLGTDLSDDHPISFTYNAALVTADGGLNDPTGATISGWLFGGKVECASCHDVHNNGLGDPLLRISNDGSALCLTCHAK